MPAGGWSPRRAELVLLAVLAGFLALLEIRQPYYFLQDDNRVSQLGLFVQWARGLASGELPLYNFHQFLGTPSFSIGSVAFFYPPMYAALLASHALFGHPDAAIDILVPTHLACGLLGMHRLLRQLELGPAAAGFGALTWPLSSMVVYASSSWWTVAAVAAWLPWMILLALRVVRRPSPGAIAALVGVRALLLYTGHVQYFVYAACFEVLCAVLAARAAAGRGLRPLGRALGPYLLSLYLGAALALPLVQPLWHHSTLSSQRASRLTYADFHAGSYDLLSWLQGAIAPYLPDPDYYAVPLGFWLWRALPHLSFSGCLTLLLLAASPWLLRRGRPDPLPVHVFAVPLLVAFLWTTGALDRALFLVPVFNRLRWHFKVNVFVVFFLVVVAAMAFAAAQGALRVRVGPARARALVAAALVAQLASLALLYGLLPQRSFNHRRIVDRPPLVEPLAPRLASGRIVSLGFLTADPYGSAQLAFDYASRWGLVHYTGYANLLSRAHAEHMLGLIDDNEDRPHYDGVFKLPVVPFTDFEEWGVAWYVLGKNAEHPAETRHYRALLGGHGLRVVAEDARRVVFHDPRALPLVSLADEGGRRPLKPRLGGRSLAVRFAPSPRPRRLLACFLVTPGLAATDRSGRPLPLESDRLGRVVVRIPPGADGARLVYREPAMRRGLRNALLLLALPLLSWAMRRRRRAALAPAGSG